MPWQIGVPRHSLRAGLDARSRPRVVEQLSSQGPDAVAPKVGYLTSHYPAPSHTFIRREIAALRGAGVDISAYSVRPGIAVDDPTDHAFALLAQPITAYLSAHVKAIFRHPVRYLETFRLSLAHRVPGAKALLQSTFYFAEAILLAERMQADGITRLHNHFANAAAIVGVLATNYARLPWSLTLHGISEFDYPAGLLLAAKLERAEFAACVSYFGMAQAMRLTSPAIWPRLHIVRCGIDPVDLPAPRPRPGSGDALELICVGRLSPEKGHAGLIATVAALVREGMPLRLTLVGEGPECEAIQALVRQEGMEAHVQMLGALDERATLGAISRADALVLCSFMEGLPVVLMEAMALGVPVVASNIAGIPELIEDGKSGLLFEPANWTQLRHALRGLSDSELRDSLAVAAKARIVEEFTYPTVADPLVRLLTARPPTTADRGPSHASAA